MTLEEHENALAAVDRRLADLVGRDAQAEKRFEEAEKRHAQAEKRLEQAEKLAQRRHERAEKRWERQEKRMERTDRRLEHWAHLVVGLMHENREDVRRVLRRFDEVIASFNRFLALESRGNGGNRNRRSGPG